MVFDSWALKARIYCVFSQVLILSWQLAIVYAKKNDHNLNDIWVFV